MNDSLIFSKTAAGEDAVKERTRLVQRNLRMVLIVVDGTSTVADLKRKTGDPSIVESALAELEAMGLVEQCAAAETAEPETPLLDEPLATHEEVVLSEEPEIRPVRPEPPPRRVPAGPSLLERARSWWEARRRSKVPEPREEEFEEAYAGDEGEVPVKIKPVTRPKGAPMSWTLRLVYAGGVLGVGLVVFLLAFPFGQYRNDFELALSELLQDPVKIGNVSGRLIPYPSIALEQVSVGGDAYATVQAIRLVPQATSLLGAEKVMHEVRVEGLRLQSSHVGRVSRWLAGDGRRHVVLHRLVMEDVGLDVAGPAQAKLGGEVEIGKQGGWSKLRLRDAENKLDITLTPAQEGLTVVAAANGWQLPTHDALKFDSLEMEGQLRAGELRIRKLDGRLFGGWVMGAGVLTWGRAAGLSASLEVKRIGMGPMTQALSANPGLEGEGSGRLQLTADAESLGQLGAVARLEGSFSVTNGALRRIDLVEALRQGGRGSPRGGTTRFEQFSGNLVSDAQGVRLANVQLASGLLRASGQARLTKDQKINGNVVVELRGSAGTARGNVTISGDAKDPQVAVAR